MKPVTSSPYCVFLASLWKGEAPVDPDAMASAEVVSDPDPDEGVKIAVGVALIDATPVAVPAVMEIVLLAPNPFGVFSSCCQTMNAPSGDVVPPGMSAPLSEPPITENVVAAPPVGVNVGVFKSVLAGKLTPKMIGKAIAVPVLKE